MSDAQDSLNTMNATLKAILALLQAQIPAPVAKASDLDGKYGDPELKFKPRDWAGPDYKGRHFSECPPALLDLVAEANDYFARVADEKGEKTEKGTPVSKYKLADAARARGWAQRLREGWVAPAGAFEPPGATQPAGVPAWAQPATQPDDDEVPF